VFIALAALVRWFESVQLGVSSSTSPSTMDRGLVALLGPHSDSLLASVLLQSEPAPDRRFTSRDTFEDACGIRVVGTEGRTRDIGAVSVSLPEMRGFEDTPGPGT
jgi:glycine cleavage system aminomethyltransferase T